MKKADGVLMYNTEKPRDVSPELRKAWWVPNANLLRDYIIEVTITQFYTGFFNRDFERNTIRLQQWTNTDLYSSFSKVLLITN